MAAKDFNSIVQVPIFRRTNDGPPNLSKWFRLFEHCWSLRTRKEDFEPLAAQYIFEYPINGYYLLDILFTFNNGSGPMVDPLIRWYLLVMLDMKKVTLAEVLDSLYVNSVFYTPTTNVLKQTVERKSRRRFIGDMDYIILGVAIRYLINNKISHRPEDLRNILKSLCKWLLAFTHAHLNMLQVMDEDMLATADALGSLAIATLENPIMIQVIDHASSKDSRRDLANALNSFIPFWAQCGSQLATQHGDHLVMAFKSRTVLEEKPTSQAGNSMVQDAIAMSRIENTQNVLQVHNRASLFVFLSSLLYARPITDDNYILQYLQNKYKVDMQVDVDSLAVDLIITSFDLLSCAMTRKDSSAILFNLKSFLINKVPLLLTTLSRSMFGTDHCSVCISQAMSHIDKDVFPSMALGAKGIVQDVREEFLFSCVLHSLVRSDNVQTLLGESLLSSPPNPSSRYVKEVLVEQCSNDSDRAVQLVDELEKLDGNGGAISLAIAETIRNICLKQSPDTTALKTICVGLASKSRSMDVLSQFVQPTIILQPICHVLDSWRYEDETEYRILYEEFSSIFLLVTAMIYQYDLSVADLGVPASSFVGRYMAKGHQAQSLDDLSEEQIKQLSNWIKILYNSDSITDEQLSKCPPQDYYLLVPTILSQMLMANSAQVLHQSALNTPLEYLQEPFLVPSLVGGVKWMLVHAWKRRDASVLPLFLRLLKKSDITSRNVVIFIVGEPVAQYIRNFSKNPKLRNEPKKIAILEQEAKTLEQFCEERRTIFRPFPELNTFKKNPTSLKVGLKQMFLSLMDWGSTLPLNPMRQPPAYSPRLLPTSVAIMGARTVLQTLLEELKVHMSLPDTSGPIALDICTTLICSPEPGSSRSQTSYIAEATSSRTGRLTLREALKISFEEAPKIIQTDQLLGECIVHLHRHVEGHLAMVMTGMAADMPAPLLPDMSDEAAAAAVVADLTAGDAMDFSTEGLEGLEGLDGGLGLGMDMDGMELDATGGAQMDFGGGMGEDDIFADLMGGSLGDEFTFG